MTGLTQRHLEIVALLAAGRSNDEVAAELGISPRTARAHTDEIRRRLGVAKRRQIPGAYIAATGRLPYPKEPEPVERGAPAGGEEPHGR